MPALFPEIIPNWIDGGQEPALGGESLEKVNPASGRPLARLTRSRQADVRRAVAAAAAAQPSWAAVPAVRRGLVLRKMAAIMQERSESLAAIVHLETGKSRRDALGETNGAIALAQFFAGEGQRLYGRTMTSAMEGRLPFSLRRPVGVAGLIVAANTPIANAAWKVFPALICGNAAVLKPAEDSPATGWVLGEVAREAGLPPGVLQIVQGLGPEAGAALVENPGVGVVSFTGSSEVGRGIAETCARRLARVSLELGGKNPFVVCDDADLDRAVAQALLSAFSNAGQRCASASRIIVDDAVHDVFRSRFLAGAAALRVGAGDGDDLGPVINLRQLTNMLAAVERAREQGAVVSLGGRRLEIPGLAEGFFMAPTVLEGVSPDWDISRRELFGPIACLYRVRGVREALDLANDSPYGLTACVHTRDMDRALAFMEGFQAGVVSINGATYGSEPHMPFGGVKMSGNGSREPGTEALDIYSELKNVYFHHDPRLGRGDRI